MPFRAKPIVPLPEGPSLALPVRTRAPQDNTIDHIQQGQGQLLALPVRTRIQQPEAPQSPPQEAPAALPFSNYAAEPKPQSRLPNRDGKAPGTQCFDNVHVVSHEYHHLLGCGHEVFTPTRQPCGGNCALKKRTTTKATGSIFMCPDPTCAARLKAQLKTERALFAKGSKAPAPRKCTLSDARDVSHHALHIRIAEAKLLRVAEMSKTAAPTRMIETRSRAAKSTRERSLSPNARASTGRSLRERSPLGARELPPMQRVQGKSKQQSDSLFVAQNEAEEVPAIAESKKYPSKVVPFDWNEHNFSSLAEKHAFDHSVPSNIYDALQHEQGATSGVDDRVYGRLPFAAVHDDEEDDNVITGEVDIQTTHCVCEQPSDGYMVECTTCRRYFHPVCVNKAQGNPKAYDSDLRHQVLQADVDHFNVITFHCHICDRKAAAKEALNSNVTVADMRKQSKAAGLVKQSSSEILKFTRQWSTMVHSEVRREWERHDSMLVPGERLRMQTKHMLNELGNKRIAEERGKEEKRVRALFQPKKAAALDAIKTQFACDGCNVGIRGTRYACRKCPSYDLCQDCFEDPVNTHQHQHGSDAMNID